MILQQIREIESGSNDAAIGDDGLSLGAYQFQKSTWNQVTKIRKRRGLPSVSFILGAKQKLWADVYAETHFQWVEQALSSAEYPVTSQWIYAVWNAGIGKVLSVQQNKNRLPEVTWRKMQQFSSMLVAENCSCNKVSVEYIKPDTSSITRNKQKG